MADKVLHLPAGINRNEVLRQGKSLETKNPIDLFRQILFCAVDRWGKGMQMEDRN